MPSICPSLSPIGSTIRLISSVRLPSSPAARSWSARRCAAFSRARASPVFLQDVGRDRLDVAAQLLAVAAHELDARLGRRELNPMLFGAGRKSLLQARDLGVVALDQRAHLDFADGGDARELGLARRPGRSGSGA